MSFPTSPTNGQTSVVNGITYSYSTSTTAWTRVAAQVTATTYLSITNNTGVASTVTGALQVVGGVGVGGGMYVGGTITATNFVGAFSGTASAATNIAGGVKDQIPYQTGVGATGFSSGLTYNGTTFTATNIIVPGTTNASSTVTGAMQVAGGLAVGKDLYVGGTLIIAGASGGDIDLVGGDIVGVGRITANTGTFTTTNISSTLGVTSTNTGALTVAGGVGVGGGMYVGGVITATNVFVGGYAVSTASALTIQSGGVGQGSAGTINFSTGLSASVTSGVATVLLTTSTLMTTAVNLAGGTAGYFAYQTGAGATAFASTASMYVGNAAVANILNAANTSTQQVGYAANLLAGSQGQIAYQSAANTTAFASSGTTGQFLQATTNGAPAFTSTGSMYVNSAVNAQTLYGGVAGSLHYQSATGVTAFTSGTTGQILVAATNAAPVYTSTGSIYVGNAAVANILNAANTSTQQVGYSANILGGAAGSLPYQSGANATTFLAGGTAQQHLVYGTGNTLVWQSTSTFSGGTASATGVANQSITVTSGGLGVTGDSYFSAGLKAGGSLIAGSTAGDTGTNTSNSLYVAGGAWIDKTLVVQGDVTFKGNAVFQGTTTNVISTNTYITDNIINLHVPPTGVNGQWAIDDGKDIGLRFHYYAGADNNAALVLNNATKYLTWYETGAENANGVFTTATYGTFQTGRVIASSTEATNSTQTGAIRVAGGVGIGGNMYVGGVVTATTFFGSLSGTAAKATNIVGGTAGQLVYQSNTDTTGFVGPGTAGQLLVSGGTSTPVYTSTGSIYVGNAAVANILNAANTGTQQVGYAANILAGSQGQIAYQSAANTTAFASSGTTGQFLQATTNGAPSFTSTGSIYVNSAVNAQTLYGGVAGSLHYQSATGVTAFTSGTTGQILVAATNAAPVYTSTGSIYVNSSVFAEEIRGGTAGQLLYQSAPNTTDYVGPGTAGQILVSGGAAIPVYTSTGSIYVGNAAVANILNAANTSTQQVGYAANILAGSQGQIAYQSAANTTAFASSGTTGQFLQATTNGAPTFTSTGSIYVNSSVNSNNIIGGAKDQIPYQSAAGATTFNSGLTFNGTTFTTTNVIVTGTTNATSTTTGALQVAGGLAVGKDLYIGGTLTIAGSSGGDIDLGGGDILGVGKILANTGTFTTTNVLSTVGVTSTNTGALQVAGGVGVGGGMFVGGVITATNVFVGGYAVSTASSLTIQSLGVGQGTAATINFSTGLSATVSSNVATVLLTTSTLMTTAVNLVGGSQGQIHYQTAAGTTAFANSGTTGQFLQATTNGAPTFTSTASMYVGNAAVANILNPANTSTQQVGYAANLLGNGVANGSLVYQSAANTTAFLAQGTAGWLLVSQGSGSAPAFTGTASIYVNSAVNANNIIGGSTNQIPYQSGTGATTFGSGLTYNGTTFTTGNISVTGNTNATSTVSGAFQVVGGAGIGGNLFVGGTAYLAGDLYVDGTQFVVNSVNISTGDKTLTLSTASTSAALAASSGLQIGSTSTPYASWLYDGSAYWVSAGSSGGGIKANATTGASSTTTGALVVAGGAGFGGNLFVGGVVTATTFFGALTGTATTATNLAGGTAGYFAYQTAAGATAFASTASMYVGNAVNSQNLLGGTAGYFAYQTGAGATAFASTASMYVNGAVSSQNLFGGAAGSLPYQTGSGATAFLSGASTQGSLLRYFGTAPVWTTTSSLSGGTASSSTVALQSLSVTSGGLGVTGASYFSTDVGMGGELNVSGHIVGGGVRSSSTSTVPASATVGDIWYNTSNDTMYRYTNDGTTSYWVDINGPAIANGSAAYMTLAAFKAVVAASSSFTDFQSRVAAL
jgi:hypothetical protein